MWNAAVLSVVAIGSHANDSTPIALLSSSLSSSLKRLTDSSSLLKGLNEKGTDGRTTEP